MPVAEPGAGYRVRGLPPTWAPEGCGAESSVSGRFPSPFETHSLSLGYEAQWVRPLEEFPAFQRFADPNEAPPTRPFEGWVTGVRATWAYPRVPRYTYSTSAQTGTSLSPNTLRRCRQIDRG